MFQFLCGVFGKKYPSRNFEHRFVIEKVSDRNRFFHIYSEPRRKVCQTEALVVVLSDNFKKYRCASDKSQIRIAETLDKRLKFAQN